jgi:hypothetical protein
MSKESNPCYEVGECIVVVASNGSEFIIDKEDYDKIKGYRWHQIPGGYISANAPMVNYRRGKCIYLHKLIMDNPNCDVDHIDHNLLDNRKSNLRAVTRSQNLMNRRFSNSKSKVTGVGWYRKENAWRVRITVDSKSIFGGLFKDLQEAIKVRKSLEEKYFKEYAYKA